jgi:hypothetical protein
VLVSFLIVRAAVFLEKYRSHKDIFRIHVMDERAYGILWDNAPM